MLSYLIARPPGTKSVVAFFCIGTIFLASGCGAGDFQRTNQRTMPDEYVQGSFVVEASPGTTDSEIAELSQTVGKELNCGVKTPERIKWSDTDVVSRDLADTFNVKFENCDLSREGTEQALAAFGGNAAVVSVEPEAKVKATPIRENDPGKSSQEHLAFIGRDPACEMTEKNGKPVVVAVIDTGVDQDHPDLSGMFFRDSRGEVIGANFVGTGSSMPHDRNWNDNQGHGTHVAGLVAAASNNSQGGVGVASCANVKIMPVRVLNDEGKGNSIEIDRGIKWAADNGAHIINLSLGFTAKSRFGTPSFGKALFSDLARRNVVVFAASGNDGYENGTAEEGSDLIRWSFPASYDNVISVAATDNTGRLTSFSNYGTRVDIAAPGQRLYSTVVGSYARMSGTSMAAPVAAGAYALGLASVKDRISGDRINVDQATGFVKSSVLGSAPLQKDSVGSGGVVDAKAIVSKMQTAFPLATDEPSAIDNPRSPILDNDPPALTTPSFGFVGLKNGAKAGRPQEIAVSGLPTGTYVVYFYWGTSPWSFTRASASAARNGTLRDSSEWYLYGNRTLTAVAYDRFYREIGKTAIQVQGW